MIEIKRYINNLSQDIKNLIMIGVYILFSIMLVFTPKFFICIALMYLVIKMIHDLFYAFGVKNRKIGARDLIEEITLPLSFVVQLKEYKKYIDKLNEIYEKEMNKDN